MDAYLADLNRSIDPVELGRRLRAARTAAGLTQNQIAAGEVSSGYISRIEDGQRRPDARLLERLAVRAGTTAHELLTGITTHEARALELQVEHAAIALTLGDTDTARTLIDAAMANLDRYRDTALRATATRVRAEALHAAGDLETAINELEQLTNGPARDLNALRCLIALCRCHSERGAPGDAERALAIGRHAETLAVELGVDGLAEILRLGAAIARAHLLRGDSQMAERVCIEAWNRVDRHQSPAARATAYREASTTEATAHGATPAAVELAQLALALADANESTRRLEEVLAQATATQDQMQ